MKTYHLLEQLDTYKLARVLSAFAWSAYKGFDWQARKTIGDQFLTCVDSIGANIAEGYGRFHYLDKVKFYYNARGSLLEANHWIDILAERKLVRKEYKQEFLSIYNQLLMMLNGLIKSAMNEKKRIDNKS